MYSGAEKLTTKQFACLFESRQWEQLAPNERAGLLQELENRTAAANDQQPREVFPLDLDGWTAGYFDPHTPNYIVVNQNLIDHGAYKVNQYDLDGVTPVGTEVDNEFAYIPVNGSSWKLYETVVHENQHALQYDESRLPSGMAYFNGTTPEGDYIKGGAELYRIQPCEDEAFLAGQKEALKAIRDAYLFSGYEDPEADAYRQRCEIDSYGNALERAKEIFNDPDIASALGEVITDREQGQDLSYEGTSNHEAAKRQIVEAFNKAKGCTLSEYGILSTQSYDEDGSQGEQNTLGREHERSRGMSR